MDTGPGYNSKRIEAVNSMLPLMQGNEKMMEIAGDLFIRNMDFPGADLIADRLAAMNPMAQIDEKSKIPPMAQMKMKQMEDQNKQLQDQIIAMQLEINNRSQVAQIKEDGANKRKLMDVTARAHNTETMAEVKVNDQNTRAVTSQNKTEIDAIVELMVHHMDTQRLIQEIEKRNAEQMRYANIAATDIDQEQNPFMGA
jgi:hypothetical protein